MRQASMLGTLSRYDGISREREMANELKREAKKKGKAGMTKFVLFD